MLLRTKLFLFFLSSIIFSSFGVGSVQAARLDLSPSSGGFKAECVSSIDVVLDTQGADTNAVDMFINYNPAEIDVIDQNSNVPGVQVKEGAQYSIYAANLVDAGRIRVTAFDMIGSYNGKGVFVTLVFKTKPGVTSSSFVFDFTAGSTTDSNVADVSSQDVLSAVGNGSYSFTSDFCNPDTQSPRISQISPSNGSSNVPLNSSVAFVLTDNQSGVDLGSLQVQIGVDIYDQAGSSLNYAGDPLFYNIEVSPSTPFPSQKEVTIIVRVQDLDGNVMPPKVITYNKPAPPPASTVSVTPATSEPVCGNRIVEDGEECEPPGTFSCNSECKIDVVACLEVDPVFLADAAIKASDTGQLTTEQLSSISNMNELVRVIKGDKIIVNGTNSTIVGGYFTNKTVEVITKSTQKIVEKIGCDESCMNALFGANNQRWYIPFAILLLLLLLLLILLYYLWRRLKKASEDKR